MLAGISFGLLISTIVPSTDVVLFVVLIQLFAQIILNGTLFKIENPTVPQMNLTYWTTVSMGSTVDMPGLNNLGMSCKVVEIQDPVSGTKSTTVQCDEIKSTLRPGGDAENKSGDYKHSPGRLLTTWLVTSMQGIFYFLLALFLLARQK